MIRPVGYEAFEALVVERLDLDAPPPGATLGDLGIDSVLVSELAALVDELLGSDLRPEVVAARIEALLHEETALRDLHAAVVELAVDAGLERGPSRRSGTTGPAT